MRLVEISLLVCLLLFVTLSNKADGRKVKIKKDPASGKPPLMKPPPRKPQSKKPSSSRNTCPINQKRLGKASQIRKKPKLKSRGLFNIDDDDARNDLLPLLDSDDELYEDYETDVSDLNYPSDDQTDDSGSDFSRDEEFSSRFWGGREIAVSRAPWIASLFSDGYLYPWCTGSFITPEVIITTAHCFADPQRPVRQYFVKYDTSKPAVDANAKILRVSEVRVHTRFDRNSGFNHPYDIALVILQGKRLGGVGAVLSLPLENELDLLISDSGPSQLQFTSTGSSYASETGHILKERDVYLYRTRCSTLTGFVNFDYEHLLCTRSGEIVTCQGDSGAPYVARFRDRRRKPVIVAIHSSGAHHDPAHGSPSQSHLDLAVNLAVNVHSHMVWILRELEKPPLNRHWRPLDPIYESWRAHLQRQG